MHNKLTFVFSALSIMLIPALHAGETVIIGAGVCNGDFNEDTSTDDKRRFSETPHWFNLLSGETGPVATKLDGNDPAMDKGDGTRNALIYKGSAFINDSGHTVKSAGEILSVSLDFRDYGTWVDGTDSIQIFFFTTDIGVDESTTEEDITLIGPMIGSTTVTENNDFEAYECPSVYTTVAEDIGKTIYAGIRADCAGHYGRADNFVFKVVTP
ncbi:MULTISPECIES: hypothetical protein [unclassified Lentimonas]|uniref:hypothetical protein n=1 Tax=unclassified Lentimonas TaxID=2630993 RepID=UPI00132AD3AB|nr:MULTISPECIES: hypothetical protein [unclassified Lentimonas]CAA6690704.1 Unannotated [Lentimonas sp. CC19]CAA6693354.1 Unannotated [Lentimonas sp. CC10]CAA7071832.1 Unannotated [Lentimonas sp. CC11]